MKISPRLVAMAQAYRDRAIGYRDLAIRMAQAHRRVAIAVGAVLSVFLLLTIATTIWFVVGVVSAIPDRAALRSIGTMVQATTLLDAQDRQAFTIFREQRIDVPLERVSRSLVAAIIAIEDQRFYDHRGVDIVRVAGAALNNVVEGRLAQGGSTITQQLARQSFLTADKTIRRKVTEVIVAARLESQYTKNEILSFYLNKVYFGDGLYGVEAAALGYFGKHASEVSVAEAALLAGLVKAPSSYAPTVSIERATARRNVVLQAMRDEKMIDRAAYDGAVKAPVVLNDGLRQGEAYGQYFKEEVRRFLVERFGWGRVYEGGLKVYTTIDLEMQKAAEAEVARALADIERRQGKAKTSGTDALQAALVAMDPQTGDVRAMVGGRDFAHSSFNRATQAKRQPGSAFKPFVYAAALERGFSPGTLITRLDEPIMTLQGAWVPEDEHLESPSMTMRMALRTSSNRAAVRMLEDVGIAVTVQYAKQLGVGSVPSVPSLALGSGEVTLVSMTSAFGTFANRGMVPAAVLVRRVETNDGEVLYTDEHVQQRAVSEATAFQMAEMLADVVNSGTAWPARREGFTLPAAGKTGTTNDYHDAWFVGFTPRLVTGVWVGYDQPRKIISRGYAAELAVPLWAHFMIDATGHDQATWFSRPRNVTSATICRLSGKLATDLCRDAVIVNKAGEVSRQSMVYNENFVVGTEPTDSCPIHGRVIGNPLRALAALFNPRSAPTSHAPVPSQPAPAAVVNDSAPPPKVETQAPRKRGFWSRVFGVGKNK
ncbi:MAG TPA: PBP1A family penicillin-binding protein [Vicinamibacterales bacterium]|nr:PBP1A family penicillin-binding protein [Vicinamibacterales bacterium]